MDDVKGLLEAVLRVHENDTGLVITSFSQEVCNPGENFMSDACAVKAVGTSGSDIPYSCNLFLKRISQCKERRELSHMAKAFTNESFMYLKILPLIPNISEITAECLQANEEAIVMTNLRADKYRVADKMKGLDLAHAELVMQAVGKIHAGTYHIKISDGEIKFNDRMSRVFDFFLENEFLITYIQSGIESGVKNLKIVEDGSLERVIHKVEGILRHKETRNIIKKMHESERLSVICHGDLWVNNMLFRYDDANNVNSVKLIDFQFSKQCSLAVDLLTFFYTSIPPELLNAKYDYLISVYSSTFINSLKLLNIPEDKLPTEEDIKKEIDSRELYAVIIAMWYLPAVLRDYAESPVDMGSALKDKAEMIKSFFTINTRLGERFAILAQRWIARDVL